MIIIYYLNYYFLKYSRFSKNKEPDGRWKNIYKKSAVLKVFFFLKKSTNIILKYFTMIPGLILQWKCLLPNMHITILPYLAIECKPIKLQTIKASDTRAIKKSITTFECGDDEGSKFHLSRCLFSYRFSPFSQHFTTYPGECLHPRTPATSFTCCTRPLVGNAFIAVICRIPPIQQMCGIIESPQFRMAWIGSRAGWLAASLVDCLDSNKGVRLKHWHVMWV